MPDTHGFDVVAELTQAALLKMVQQAWVTDLLPKNLTVGPQTIGAFPILGAQAQVPEAGLDVKLVPSTTLNVIFNVDIQVQLQNPPVPSAGVIEIDAQVSVPVPVGSLPGKQDVALLFASLPPADPNNVTLAGGDPIEAHLHDYITEFVHKQFQANGPEFPHTISQTNQSLVLYTYDAQADLMDITGDPAHEIAVNFPVSQGQQQLQIAIPLHLKIFNIQTSSPFAPALVSPMGVEAQLVLTTNLVHAPGSGSVAADLSAATVAVQNLVPAGPDYGVEGPNYVQNRTTLSFINLDTAVASALQSQGQTIVATLQPVAFSYPKPADIQQFIAEQVRQTLQARGSTEIWPGMAAVPPQLQVTTVGVTITPDVLIIAVNANPGSDITQIGSFVSPAGLFAVAISGQKTMAMLNAAITQQFPTLPVILHNIGGHDVRLKSLKSVSDECHPLFRRPDRHQCHSRQHRRGCKLRRGCRA